MIKVIRLMTSSVALSLFSYVLQYYCKHRAYKYKFLCYVDIFYLILTVNDVIVINIVSDSFKRALSV